MLGAQQMGLALVSRPPTWQEGALVGLGLSAACGAVICFFAQPPSSRQHGSTGSLLSTDLYRHAIEGMPSCVTGAASACQVGSRNHRSHSEIERSLNNPQNS